MPFFRIRCEDQIRMRFGNKNPFLIFRKIAIRFLTFFIKFYFINIIKKSPRNTEGLCNTNIEY
jgi:hypothetical protein